MNVSYWFPVPLAMQSELAGQKAQSDAPGATAAESLEISLGHVYEVTELTQFPFGAGPSRDMVRDQLMLRWETIYQEFKNRRFQQPVEESWYDDGTWGAPP